MQRLPPSQPSAEELAFRKREGTVSPNIQLALAHAPLVAQKQLELVRAITDGLDLRDREVIILTVGVTTDNGYCWGFHVRPGLRAGLAEAEIRAILQGDDTALCASDRLLARFTRAVIAQDVTDEMWDQVSEGRSHEEMVKLMMLIGFYCMIGKVTAAVGVPLDPGQGEADGESWSPLVRALINNRA